MEDSKKIQENTKINKIQNRKVSAQAAFGGIIHSFNKSSIKNQSNVSQSKIEAFKQKSQTKGQSINDYKLKNNSLSTSSISGTGTINKKALKSLGFRVSKKNPLNFYENWKFEFYPDVCMNLLDQIMRASLVTINEQEKDQFIGPLLQTFFDKLTEDSKKLPAPLLPKLNRDILKEVIDSCSLLLDQQKQLESIVKIQSLWRGKLTRKKVGKWVNENGIKITQSKSYQCNVAFRDLLKAEDEYIKCLEIIVNDYIRPLEKSINNVKKNSVLNITAFNQQLWLSKEDMQNIFANVEELLNLHNKIYRELKKIKWPFLDNIGETFIRLAPDLIVYGDYVSNCKNAFDTLVRCQNESPKFKEFLETTRTKVDCDLMGLLVRPLNHIPQYSMVLKMCKKYVPPNHPDICNIRNAYVAIKKTCKFIQDSNAMASKKAKILDIQRKLVFGNNNSMQLLIPKREFIKEGFIQTLEKTMMFNTEKQRYYFLFNDIFLITEEITKGHKLLNSYNLNETIVEDNPQNANQFTLSTQSNVTIKNIFITKTKEEKIELLNKLKQLVNELNIDTRVFGVPLNKILEREKQPDNIPFIVKLMIEFLRKKKEVEGIFRISGGTAEVERLKNILNKAVNPKSVSSLDLNQYSPHTVAGILKSYFRELPEPILTFDLYKKMAVNEFGDPKERIIYLKSIVSNIPEANKIILKYLFQFLCEVAEYGNINKMTFSNLSIVFGPNLLYPEEETLENILLIPKLNTSIQCMIENYKDIF